MLLFGGLGLAACGPTGAATDAAADALSKERPVEGAAVDPIDPVGHWATSAEACARRPWTIAETRIVRPGGETCLLRSVASTAHGWRADATCPRRSRMEVRLNPLEGVPQRLEIRGFEGEAAELVLRCGRPRAEARSQLRAPLQAATEIDRQIASDATVQEGKLGAGLNFARIWRRDGRLMKVTAPIGGGPKADRDRSYYFMPDGEAPFLIQDPDAVYAVADGRIVTWFSARGALISALVPDTATAFERNLLIDAKAVGDAARRRSSGGARR